MGIFSSKPAKPAIIPTDTIIPVHSEDDQSSFRALVLDISLCFDDVLDPEKLRSSLQQLINIGGWKKLGARLRMNDNGKLEYHIPAQFDQERSAFRYSHLSFETKISEHPLASKLPKPSTRPAVLCNSSDFQSILRSKDGPKKLDDYLYSDEGQLCLHIVSFTDATLVSLTWPHTLFDAMGRRSLLDAWISVINGHESDVLPVHGFDADPLAELGTKPTEPHVLEKYQLKGFSFFMFVAHLLFEVIWYSKEEMRVLFLPAAHIKSMKSAALSELSQDSSDPECKAFVSEGDIISAWWARIVCSVLPRNSKRTVMIMNALGLRSVLANDLLPASRAYIGNAALAVFALIPASDLLVRPISYAASAIRHSLKEQNTRPQIEAFAAIAAKARENPSSEAAIFGDGSTKMVVISNWTKAGFFDLDFSSAVLKEGISLQERKHGLGKPGYVHSYAYATGLPTRNTLGIYGKDAAGNYWMGGFLRTETWGVIEERFKEGL